MSTDAVQSGAGQSQAWSYDALNGQLLSQTNGFGETTTFQYDNLGRVSGKIFDSGQHEEITYDVRGRLASVVLRNSSGTALRTQTYTYDDSSKVLTHTVDGVTTTYSYDAVGQLLSETRPGYSGSYTYDGNGNRLTRTVNSVTEHYVYDDGDKLLEVAIGGSPVKTYSYDAAGRTTQIVSAAGTTTITYDYESRATSIVGPGVNQTNVYNGLDTRVGSTTNSVTQSYLRDGAYVTDPVLSDGSAVYTPGVSERRAGDTTFLHSGLKNADVQSSTTETVAATRQYDAFGNVISDTGTWSGPFGYAGALGYQEDATGLKLLGHRYYDPSTGRFLTRDPIKDGRNWYGYGGGTHAPSYFFDPDGKAVILIGLAVVGAVSLIAFGAYLWNKRKEYDDMGLREWEARCQAEGDIECLLFIQRIKAELVEEVQVIALQEFRNTYPNESWFKLENTATQEVIKVTAGENYNRGSFNSGGSGLQGSESIDSFGTHRPRQSIRSLPGVR